MIDLTKVYEITPQWLAGFFDGEGLVGIYIRKNRLKSATLEIKLAQKDITVLFLIANKFKGGSWAKSQGCCELRYYGINAREFLEYIQLYVIVKKTQVDLAIKFLNNEVGIEVVDLIKQQKQVMNLN